MLGKYDVCLCIDGSAGMKAVWDNMKANAGCFFEQLSCALQRNYLRFDGFRVRVIVFRDYACDGKDAMVETDFFDLTVPEEEAALRCYIDSIEFKGGSGGAVNALEAIDLAIRSDWAEVGRIGLQTILLLTNAPAWPLRRPSRMISPFYPKGVPADLDGLLDRFEHGDVELTTTYRSKKGRLVVIAPASAESSWNPVRIWERAWVVFTDPEGCCDELDLEDATFLFASDY